MSKSPGNSVTLKLDADTSRRLDELARRSGTSREQIVADALREHLKRADPSIGTDRDVPPPKGG
jgi:predicted transcriptional regulator